MANLFEPSRYIAVEGPIRVGKSTLTRFLATQLHGQLVQEAEENPFLSAFYEGEPGAAFQAQFAFLIRRFEQLDPCPPPATRKKSSSPTTSSKKTSSSPISTSPTPSWRFTTGITNFCAHELPTPDLVIYLQAPLDVLRKRLRRKNVSNERALSDEYMEEVVKAYEHFFFHYSASDLLVVNTAEIDFVERSEDLQVLLRRVSEPIKGTQYFLPLGQQDHGIE